MTIANFEQKLEKYAELVVKVGLNIQPGQRLVVLAGLDTAPLVRLITASAYQLGSRLVSIVWVDEQINKIRYQNAPKDSFDEFPGWLFEGISDSIQEGDAYLQVWGRDPELLKGEDPELVAIHRKTRAKHYKAIGDQQSINAVQWTVICPPTPGWATKIFPDITEDAALSRLWEAVFKACRLDDPDPITFWEGYLANLAKRRDYLTAKAYTALKFTASGTDLKVGLPEGHIWAGGKSKSSQGTPFAANLPTEEVFTLPHKDQTEGTVSSTKPLNYYGSLVENFKLTFSEGKVVDFSAEKGEEVLKNILAMDENAGFLGEVALIPHKSPISQSGLIFMNTLYDENASNHLALGSAYQFTLKGGEAMSVDEFALAGGNDSLIHIDFMFGSGDMDVDGITTDGETEQVMRAGEWAFDV